MRGIWSADAAGSDGFTYFPTASPTDGKMLCVAGDALATLSGTTVTVSFSVPATQSTFVVGFFDGRSGNGNAANGQWDQSTTAFNTRYNLYADPAGQGTGTTLVASWLGDSTMSWNAWTDFTVTNTSTALAPSGRYFYTVVASAVNRTIAAPNSFKFRVSGTSYITPTKTFGVIGAANAPMTNTTYDGSWDFFVRVPQGRTHFDLWDGDFDLANDINDLNTASTPPTWSTSAAVAEGALPGNPADDNTGSAYLRSPNVTYELFLPNGSSYVNTNPSGDSEWERFSLDTESSSTAVADYYVPQIPAGLWRLRVSGVDQHNLNALRFEDPVLGVDASGTPVEPIFPYAVGDRVWLDSNRNGLQDPAEGGIAGVTLTMRDSAGSFIATASTDASGTYRFTTLPGTFTVDAADTSNYVSGGPLAGLVATTPKTRSSAITIANDLTLDFGLARGPALVVTKAVAPSSSATALAGEETTYVVTVRNVGETTATSIVVTDTLVGSDMSYVAGSTAATYTGGTSTADPTVPTTSTVRWDFGSGSRIGAGATLTLTYRIRVKPGTVPGTYADTVAVRATDASGTAVAPDGQTWIPDDTDPDDADSASVWVSQPELQITKRRTSTDTTIQAGDAATFEIVVRNTGDSRVATVPVTDSFASANLRYANASPTPSGVTDGLLSWANVGSLDPGQQTTVTVTLTAAAAPVGNTAMDTAVVGPALDVFDNLVPAAVATASVDITRPHLSVTKSLSSSDATIQAGQNATFDVVVKNDGDTRVGAVSLTDIYENAYLTFASSTPSPVLALATSTLTTYAVAASDPSGTWSNDADSLGPTSGTSASSGNPPFDMWHSFAFPADMASIDGATITVRSQASGPWGGLVGGTIATYTKRPSANPNGLRGSIQSGGFSNTLSSDNSYLVFREDNNNPDRIRMRWTNWTSLTEVADTAVSAIRVVFEADRTAGNDETLFVRFWDYSAGNWSTTWYPTAGWPVNATEASFAATVTDTTAIRDYLDASGSFQIEVQDAQSIANAPSDNSRSSISIDYFATEFDVNTATYNDDTWAIQYSTNSGLSWASITAASTTSEGGLTDHVLNLAGILTPANAADFRVRVVGSAVGSADGAGTAAWDSSKLDLTYKRPVANGVLTWSDLGALDPGEQTTVTVSFVASASPAGQSTVDTATTGATTDVNGDTVPSSSGIAAVAVTRPGIAISKTLAPSQPATAGVGAPVRFQVLVTNTGDTTITAASVTDTWSPTYLEYVSAVPAATTVGSGAATWSTLPPIAPGKVATLTITYTARDLPPGGTTVNRVRTSSVSDVNGDPVGDAAAEASVSIADTRVSITKTRTSPAPVIKTGEVATYTVTVRNTGLKTLVTVPVTDVFEGAHLAYSSALPTPSGFTANSLSWDDVGPLAPGEQTTITIGLAAVHSTDGRATVDTATVAGAMDSDGVSAGSVSATASVVVSWNARIDGLWSADAAQVGQNVTVGATHINHSASAIVDSVASYTIWWDENGDGVFNAGDLYIDDVGAPHAYDGTSTVSTHITTGITVAGNGGTWAETEWSTSNALFPNQGTYQLTEVWKTADRDTHRHQDDPVLLGADARRVDGRRRGIGAEIAAPDPARRRALARADRVALPDETVAADVPARRFRVRYVRAVLLPGSRLGCRTRGRRGAHRAHGRVLARHAPGASRRIRSGDPQPHRVGRLRHRHRVLGSVGARRTRRAGRVLPGLQGQAQDPDDRHRADRDVRHQHRPHPHHRGHDSGARHVVGVHRPRGRGPRVLLHRHRHRVLVPDDAADRLGGRRQARPRRRGGWIPWVASGRSSSCGASGSSLPSSWTGWTPCSASCWFDAGAATTSPSLSTTRYFRR